MFSWRKRTAAWPGLALVVLASGVSAQDGASDFSAALLREDVLRSKLSRLNGDVPASMLGQLRDLVAEYEQIANQRPRSNDSDDALYQGALLAADAFWQFGDDVDRATALRLFRTLRERFPASPLNSRVAVHTKRLTAAPKGNSSAAIDAERQLPTPAPPATLPSPSANSNGGFSLSRQLGLGISRVVIDAGHGGHDLGATATELTEAAVTLDVALRLEKLLLGVNGVEVVMTRRTDEYIPLEERTAMANRSGADLFLSIHVNASPDPQARGVETYFLNFAPGAEAEAIAARENAGSARTMHNLPDIVKAIALNNKIDESRDFAARVQAAMYERLRESNRGTRNLGVKQAPFVVLIGATMPSVLAEISFVTNRRDASLLRTPEYRQTIAEALFSGISSYQRSLKSAHTAVTQ